MAETKTSAKELKRQAMNASRLAYQQAKMLLEKSKQSQ